MRSILIFIGFVAIMSTSLTSCEKNNEDSKINKCNVSNPTEELDWLKQEIDDIKKDEYSYYMMATYKGETVFYYGNCNPVATYFSIMKNCSGSNLGETIDLIDEVTDITILWKHKNSICNL